MKGKIVKVEWDKITIRPNQNFVDIQIYNGSHLDAKLGSDVTITFGRKNGNVEVLINGCFFNGILT